MKWVLSLCGIPRSTYYYRLKHPEPQPSSSGGRPIPGFSKDKEGHIVSDARIKGYLTRLIQGEHSACGYRKLTALLRRNYRLVINKKKVYRLCKEMKILSPQREIHHPVPKKIARNRVVTGPNQLWQLDIKYGYVAGKRRHFFVANLIDVFDRNLVGYCRGRACSAQDVIKATHKALLKRNALNLEQPLVIRTDNGTQFTSKVFHAFCAQMNIEHERIPNHTPNMNAYVESFHSILERECFQRHCFESYEEAFHEVDRFMTFYNKRRLHGSLKDMPPVEYWEKAMAGLIQPRNIAV